MKAYENLQPRGIHAQLLDFEIPQTNAKHVSVYARAWVSGENLEMSQEKFNLKFFR